MSFPQISPRKNRFRDLFIEIIINQHKIARSTMILVFLYNLPNLKYEG